MHPVDVLKLPFHAAQIATGAKSFQANPILGSRRLNERGLHTARVKLAMRMAEHRRAALGRHVSSDVRDQYGANGFVRIEGFLPDSVFTAVQREIEEDFERFDMIQGGTITRRAMIDVRDLHERPGLRAARGDPRLAPIIRYVASVGGEPLSTLQIVLAQPSVDADPQTVLHSDTFHPTAKAWLFLHDVGEEDGPFAYVPGSHRMTPQRLAWEHDVAANADAIENRYAARGSLRVAADELLSLGYGEPRRMVVSANTLVVADTHGFHARSPSAKPTTRVEIYSSLRRNPFVPWTGGHVASIPPIAARTNALTTSGLGRLSKLGLRKSPWLARGLGPIREWPAELA